MNTPISVLSLKIVIWAMIYVQKVAFCRLQNTPKCVSGRVYALDLTGGAHRAPQTLNMCILAKTHSQ